MKIKAVTLGCKVNQYETQAILSMLQKNAITQVTDGEDADIVLINSCTVTASSDKKVRQTFRQEKKKNPHAIMILTGCMAQAFPEKSQELDDADIIIGTTNRKNLVGHIMNFMSHKQRIIDIQNHENNEKFEDMEIDSFSDRTRAYLKIQDGCNRFCSYCIIPYARGRVRSKALDLIKKELTSLSENGYKEIVLTGINLSCYGQDLGLDLCDAVELACETYGIERVRLGSLEPEKLDINVIKRLSKCEKLCPQFHLSLQSGCDETLQRMNRHYSTDDYRIIVKNLREHFENVAITTDIMVGFPGETDEEFDKSYSFVKEICFSQAHVFAYSRRQGTKAYDMSSQITNSIKDERSKKMISLAIDSKLAFHKKMQGQIFDVLFEREVEKNVYEGHTSNYVNVLVSSSKDLKTNLLPILINSFDSEHCYGKISK